MTQTRNITVNGESKSVTVPDDMPLLWVLRDVLGPDDGDIDAAMAGNICRCGTYVRIRDAIKRAAAGRSA